MPVGEGFARGLGGVLAALVFMLAGGCTAQRESQTVVMLIESSPISLDPRIGTDAQSERIG